ncbi:MAG: hypothetical protein H8D23_09350 [Candidatus Brocadiales bacterium]|nr:hypothetical protein [Candidatus Brocadiales bacterium]
MAKAKKKVTKKKVSKKASKVTKKKPAKKEMLLVLSKTKEALKGGKLNVSPETFDALNEHIYWLISQAQARCEANGRKTVRPYDILA